MQEVPCVRLAHLSDAQKRAYVIADNKIALNAGWDEELLALEMRELIEEFPGQTFVDAIGFDDSEIRALLGAAGDDPDAQESEHKPMQLAQAHFTVVVDCADEPAQWVVSQFEIGRD